MSAGGRVDEWNRAAEAAFGHSRADAVGRELAELIIPPRFQDRHRAALARYLETGRASILDRRVEFAAVHADGHEFPIELTVTRLPGSDPPSFAGFVRDLTATKRAASERERLERRLTFLADAGAVLDRSLELTETLDALANLTVPALAELCVIDVLQRTGVIGCAAAAATSPEWAEALRDMRDRFPLDPAGRHPVAQVLRSGEAVLLPEMSDEYLRTIARGSDHFELIARLRYRSALVIPLIARGHALGALSLLRMEESTRYGHDELALAQELARRAATAVDNARLYEETRHIAVTLQRALLPRALPQPPGCRLVARYRAASDAQQVGGDFYDAFAIDQQTHGLVIGDVCGKGAEAAALTALARYTIRGAATHDSRPRSVMRALNEAVYRDQGADGRFLTAIYATVEHGVDGLELCVASGGHPPPFVARAGGEVEPLAAAGPLLGLTPRLDVVTAEATLRPGDTLILYTDGVTDAGAPQRILSERDMAALIARSATSSAEAIADTLERTALELGRPRDDIALLVLKLVGAPEPRPVPSARKLSSG